MYNENNYCDETNDMDGTITIFPKKYPPNFQKKLEKYQTKIVKMIGNLQSSTDDDDDNWLNDANTVDELLENAYFIAPQFKAICEQISHELTRHKHFISFRLEDSCLIKSKESLNKKIMRYKTFDVDTFNAVKIIRDAVRATFVLESPYCIRAVAECICQKFEADGEAVIFENIWLKPKPSGYVGVHSIVRMFVPDHEKKKCVLCEIQIHLREIYLVKEEQHAFYKQSISDNLYSLDDNKISKILYFNAMKKICKNTKQQQLLPKIL